MALTSAMACRIHRNLIIELLDLEGTAGGKPLAPLKFADRQMVNETLPTSTIIRVLTESDGPHGSREEV